MERVNKSNLNKYLIIGGFSVVQLFMVLFLKTIFYGGVVSSSSPLVSIISLNSLIFITLTAIIMAILEKKRNHTMTALLLLLLQSAVVAFYAII